MVGLVCRKCGLRLICLQRPTKENNRIICPKCGAVHRVVFGGSNASEKPKDPRWLPN